MNKKISALIILKNEEDLIRNCLESIKKIVDDMVVVHDGKCKDKTLEIVKKYTDKIYIEEERNNPEYQKVKYFNLNKKKPIFNHNFILSIDADEEIPEELAKEIQELDLSYDGYYIRRKSIARKENETYYLRLFDVNKIKLFGFYHNDFKPKNKKKFKKLENFFLHNKSKKVGESVDWFSLEAKGLIEKNYNFYNQSLLDIIKIRLMLFMKTKIFMRKLYRKILYKKYLKLYGQGMVDLRMRIYDRLTEEILKNKT